MLVLAYLTLTGKTGAVSNLRLATITYITIGKDFAGSVCAAGEKSNPCTNLETGNPRCIFLIGIAVRPLGYSIWKRWIVCSSDCCGDWWLPGRSHISLYASSSALLICCETLTRPTWISTSPKPNPRGHQESALV